MAFSQELHRLPFTYAEELTTGIDAGTTTMCTFLHRHGLHNRGLWQRECSCSRKQPWGSLALDAAPTSAALFGIGAQVPLPLGAVHGWTLACAGNVGRRPMTCCKRRVLRITSAIAHRGATSMHTVGCLPTVLQVLRSRRKATCMPVPVSRLRGRWNSISKVGVSMLLQRCCWTRH
jgi:hypothetical protein